MNKRKNYLINPGFQIKFSLFFLIPMAFAITTFWIAVEVFFQRMMNFGASINLDSNHGYYEFLSLQRNEILGISLWLILILSIIFFLIGLLYSHRIAGPLYLIKKRLDQAKSPKEIESDPIVFRKHDYFQELAQTINYFVSRK